MAEDVIIIGAGITGLATAHALACDGVSVRIIEAYAPAAMGSGWTLAGVRQSGRHASELGLARDAVARWATLEDTLGAPTGYRRSGNLRLARGQDEVPVIERLVADQAAAGLDITLLDAATLRVAAPGLAPHILCASFCASDGQAEPDGVAAAYHAALTRMGVRIETGVRVHRIETAQGRFAALDTEAGRRPAGACLVAAGIGTPGLLAPLGVDLPLRTPLVTVVQTAPMAPCLGPVLGVANADMAARQQADGRLRVSSGVAPWQGQVTKGADGRPVARPTARRLARTIDTVASVLPALAEAPVERFWGGVIDLTPDGLPALDAVPGVDGLFCAAGFSGHGFGIGPAVGHAMAGRLTGRAPELDLSPFAVARFSGHMAPHSEPELHG
jgi:sarcosine oxidase subunit beta